MKDISIRLKLLVIVFSSIIVVSAIVMVESIITINNVVEINVKKYEEDAYSSKIEELKNYTTTSIHKIEHFYNKSQGKSKKEIEELKKEALSAISKIRYGKSGYFWVNDSNHTVLSHIKKSLIGKNLKDLRDPDGVFLYQEIVKVANANKAGGVVKYKWEKPGEKKPMQKFSYVIRFEPWDMIVGTGVYVDDIEKHVMQIKTLSNEKIKESTLTMVLATLVAIIIIAIIVNFVSKSMILTPMKKLENGLLSFFSYLNKETNDCQDIDINSKDEIGKMASVINQNITKTKKLIQDDENLIQDVKSVVHDVEDGHLTSRVKSITSNESLEELKQNLNDMLSVLEKTIAKDINIVKKVLDQYSNLNFLQTIDDDSELANKVNTLAKIINEMLKTNQDDGYSLELNANTLKENVDKLSTSSNEQAASLEETAAALEEITSTMRNNTSNMSLMSKYADELSKSVGEGQSLANETTVSMDTINEEVTAISEAITVIDQIAFQTNILSLNAAVEAATAGEAGKGFAVVAGEVRNLAARSAEAASEIKTLVENATSKANSGKDISYRMISGYEGLNQSIANTLKIIADVSSASKEQMQGIEQINDALTLLDKSTQQNAMVASQTNQIADDVNDMATKIVNNVNEKDFIGKK